MYNLEGHAVTTPAFPMSGGNKEANKPLVIFNNKNMHIWVHVLAMYTLPKLFNKAIIRILTDSNDHSDQ